MISAEILSNKLQELMGSDYLVSPLFYFNDEYTTARETNGEIVQYYNDKYAETRKNHIIAIVNTINPQRANVDYYYLTASFSVTFSVPFIKGRFNFFKDYEELENAVLGNDIDFGGGIYGKLTLTEPQFRTQESDGEITYNIYEVTGNIVLTDSAKFGSKYTVELKIDNQFIKLDGVIKYSETLNLNGNASMSTASIKVSNAPSQSGWVLTFSIEDHETENKARQLIYDTIHNNNEIVNASGLTELEKRKVTVRLANGRELTGIMSIAFDTDANGIGIYSVSIVDSNKRSV